MIKIFFKVTLLSFLLALFNSLPAQNTIGVASENNRQQLTNNSLHSKGMAFTPNKGQVTDIKGNLCPEVLYRSQTKAADIYLRKTGISYVYNNTGEVMHKIKEQVAEMAASGLINRTDETKKQSELLQNEIIKMHRIDMDFEGANADCKLVNEDEQSGYQNYYYPHCPQGITNVKQYNKVTYKNIYNGIDVCFGGGSSLSLGEVRGEEGIKYDLIVQPHADPNQIKLHWKGAMELKITNEKLRITTSVNEFTETLPKVYQNINGKIVDIKCKYKLDMRCEMLDKRSNKAEAESQSHISCLQSHIYEVTFELGTYNLELPLIIDPATWFTYYGGNGADNGADLAMDGIGNIVFTGSTSSSNFPVSIGAQQGTYGGGFGSPPDAFCVKLTSAGTLLWATYYGGNAGGVNGEDWGYSIVCDALNNVIFCGATGTGNIPMGATGGNSIHQNTSGGNYDNFIVKLNSLGTRLWSTFYGGSGSEYASGSISVDNANNVILSANTYSANNIASFGPALNGTDDAYIVKFSPTGVRQWSTYFGGSGNDRTGEIETDNANNIYIVGITTSTNFPVSASPHQAVFGGVRDGFIAKFDATGTKTWATYYGGSAFDNCTNIAMDSFGSLIIYGTTQGSATGIATVGAPLPTLGSSIGFLVKFNTAGVRQWGTYDGMIMGTGGSDLALDANNNIYLLSEWEDQAPPDGTISSCAYQNYFASLYSTLEDVYITKYDPNGKKTCLTALGGTMEDDLDGNGGHGGIVIDGNSMYVLGQTWGDFPVTSGALQTVFGGGTDAFIGKLCINICEAKALGLNFTPNTNSVCTNTSVSFDPYVSNTCDTTGYKFQWTFSGASILNSTAIKPTVTYTTPGTYSVKLVLTTLCKKDSITKMIVVNSSCVVTVKANDAVICPNACTILSATGSGGTPPYTYSWSNGATTSTISVCPTANTNYIVTIKDALGNSSSAPVSVTVHAPIVTTPKTYNITCKTDGRADIIVTSAAFPYTYNWSNGFTGYSIEILLPGNYWVTVTDANGCTKVDPFTITNSSPASATFNIPSPICVGQNACFIHTGSAGTSDWSISPTNPGVSGTTLDFCYTFLTAGNYSVRHVVSNGGCQKIVEQNITVSTCNGPSITATSSSICSGACASITSTAANGTSPYTYSWSTGATTKDIAPCPLSTTTYTVKVTDAGGGTSTSTAVVTVHPAITATSTVGVISCSGGTGSITATGSGGTSPYTFNWSTGATSTGASSTIPNLPANTYTVTVTDNKGCTTSTNATLNAPPPLLGHFTKGSSSCSNCGCQEWILVNAIGGTSPYSYLWQDTYDKRYKNKVCPGNYLIKVTDKNGCSVDVNVSAP